MSIKCRLILFIVLMGVTRVKTHAGPYGITHEEIETFTYETIEARVKKGGPLDVNKNKPKLPPPFTQTIELPKGDVYSEDILRGIKRYLSDKHVPFQLVDDAVERHGLIVFADDSTVSAAIRAAIKKTDASAHIQERLLEKIEITKPYFQSSDDFIDYLVVRGWVTAAAADAVTGSSERMDSYIRRLSEPDKLAALKQILRGHSPATVRGPKGYAKDGSFQRLRLSMTELLAGRPGVKDQVYLREGMTERELQHLANSLDFDVSRAMFGQTLGRKGGVASKIGMSSRQCRDVLRQLRSQYKTVAKFLGVSLTSVASVAGISMYGEKAYDLMSCNNVTDANFVDGLVSKEDEAHGLSDSQLSSASGGSNVLESSEADKKHE